MYVMCQSVPTLYQHATIIRRTELRGCRHLVGFASLFDISTRILLRLRCAGGGSRPPDVVSAVPYYYSATIEGLYWYIRIFHFSAVPHYIGTLFFGAAPREKIPRFISGAVWEIRLVCHHRTKVGPPLLFIFEFL